MAGQTTRGKDNCTRHEQQGSNASVLCCATMEAQWPPSQVELNDTALESTQVPQHLIDPPMLPFLDPRVEHALLLTGLGAGAFLEWYRDPSRLFSPSLTPRSWGLAAGLMLSISFFDL
eukprot:1144380-Pelagomonas_calceolata.AAC.4